MPTKTLKGFVAGEKRGKKPVSRGKTSTQSRLKTTPLEKLQQARLKKKLEAKYDSAQITTENRCHWSQADDRTPVQANNPSVRMRLRTRARYEWENNCICSGMISTRSSDIIGYTAPRPQLLTDDSELNKYIEEEWALWSNHPLVNLPNKLKVLDEGKQVEGEQFLAIQRDVEAFDKTGFELGITTLSANRICDPSYASSYVGLVSDPLSPYYNLYNDDGVYVDPRTGRAKFFSVASPYDGLNYESLTQSKVVIGSRYLLHWYTPRRSGQFRGISELTPSLPLFAQLRRYMLATLSAVETAALLAGIMKTNVPTAEPSAVTEWTKTELERGTLLTLPDGWDATQFKPEQPVTTFDMFYYCVAREIGRAMNVPVGVVLGDSSRYNYSSARLDYGWYDQQLIFFRDQLVIRVLNPLFEEWLWELASIDPRISSKLRERGMKYFKRNWQFTKRPSIDPQKDAEAATERLNNGTSNLAVECAANGDNWEEITSQREKEIKKNSKNSLDNGKKDGTIEGDKTTPVESNEQAAQTADIQATALNGAQVASLVAIADKAMAKEYPIEAAVIMVQLAFPLVNVDLVRKMMTLLYETKKPETKPSVPVDNNGSPITVA